jgi:hypothetical protein
VDRLTELIRLVGRQAAGRRPRPGEIEVQLVGEVVDRGFAVLVGVRLRRSDDHVRAAGAGDELVAALDAPAHGPTGPQAMKLSSQVIVPMPTSSVYFGIPYAIPGRWTSMRPPAATLK